MTPATHPSDPRSSSASGAGLLWRGFGALAFLAACLPFLQTARFPPLAGFWHEAVAAALYLACSVLGLWLARSETPRGRRLPVTAFGLAAAWFAMLLVAQASASTTRYPTEVLIAASIVALAFFVHISGLAMRAHASSLLRAWALGVTAAMLLNAGAVALRFAGWEFIGLELVPASEYPRPIGLVGQANHLGVLGVLGVICAGFLRARAGLPSVPFWVIVAIGSVVCAASGSRAALLVALCSAGVLLCGLRRQPGGWRTALACLSIFVAAQLAWAAWTQWGGAHPSSTGISAMRAETSGRVEMLRDAGQLFLSSPWFGVGAGNYPGARLFDLTGTLPAAQASHAHNLFAQVAAEFGLLGGLPVMLAALVIPVAALRRAGRESTPETMLVAVMAVALFVFSLVEHPLWFTYFLLAIAWLLGLVPAPFAQPTARLSTPLPTRPLVALLAAAFALLLVAVSRDYARIQDVTTRLYNAVGMNRPDRAPGAGERLALLKDNLLPKLPEILLLRALPVDRVLTKDKLEIAERAVRSIPNAETVIHYTIFLTLDKGHEEGNRFLEPLRARSTKLYEPTVKALASVAPLDPELARLASLHGVDVPTPTPPEPPAGVPPRR